MCACKRAHACASGIALQTYTLHLVMTDQIPEEISVYKLIQSHVVEIHSLKKQCKTKQCKQSVQRIPRHMRRRAASNNPKRLPKELRQFAIKQNGERKKRKSKSRKVGTRNKDPRRTLLHMWFAKRFKLVPKWNSLIPYKNNSKNQRLLYRCGHKNGYTVFALPFLKSLLLDFSSANKETLLSNLAHFCSQNDLRSLTELADSHRATIHLFERDHLPRNLIAPLQCVLVQEQNCLLITVHMCAYDNLLEHLSLHLDKSIVIRKDLALSHIRLYGRKSSHHLNRVFFHKQQPLFINQLPQQQFSCFQVDCKDKLLTSPESVLQLSHFIKMFNPPTSEQSSTNENEPQLTTIALRRHLINEQIETTDLMIDNKHLKSIWNRITQNMSHLVGGWRDLEVMSVETRCPLFPSIGYLDLKSNQPSVPGFDVQERPVIRDSALIASLSTLSPESATNADHKDGLVYVTIDYLKGTPSQHDLIYIPEINGLERHLASGKVEPLQTPPNEPAAGFVEFGSYCMQAAKCRAVAVVTLQALLQMINTQRNLTPNDKIFALVATKFNHVNLVTISVIDTFNLT